MDEEAASAPPQRVLVGSRAELAEALLTLIGRSRRQLRFAAANLAVFALGDPKVVDGLRRMLVADSTARIRLLADDMAWLDAGAPRLRNLQRSFPHALRIRRTQPPERVGQDAYAVGDAEEVLRLQPTAALQGELSSSNGPLARELISEFDRHWEFASHDEPAKPLGL
jgi:hypothetical protein